MFEHIPPLYWEIVFFIVGLMFGSFFNVCILRIPAKESIVKPASHCTACGYELKWYDNIPILSYLILRGKCRQCGKKFSIRYMCVEILTGFLFLLVYLHFGFSWFTPFALVFISFIIIMSFIDLDTFILPDRFTLPLIPLGVLSFLVRPDFSLVDSLLGILAGGGLIFLFSAGYYLLKGTPGMGGGDIKLMAGVGAYLGIELALMTIMIGTITGTIAAIPLLISKKKNMDTMLPFGPFLALGAVICLFWGEEIFRFWMEHPLIDLRVD